MQPNKTQIKPIKILGHFKNNFYELKIRVQIKYEF